MGNVLVACLSMALRDSLCTGLTSAESRGKALLSGALDALCDLAGIVVTVAGAGPVLQHGLTGSTAILLGAMTATSFVGTSISTKLCSRLIGSEKAVVSTNVMAS